MQLNTTNSIEASWKTPLCSFRNQPGVISWSEDGSDICFREMAKITDFLATFQVHPWTILTYHEPVLQMMEWLGNLVRAPLCGS
jgi:hypothetical protein